MADNRPNVTVVYQEARQPGPTLGAVLLEVVVFLALAGLIVFLGGGCMMFM